jgi:hypothetical protein
MGERDSDLSKPSVEDTGQMHETRAVRERGEEKEIYAVMAIVKIEPGSSVHLQSHKRTSVYGAVEE